MSGEGVLIRAVSSFYDLETENRRILRCRARGHLRLGEVEPLPGDRVRYELDPFHPDSGILTDVLPRKNAMIRPSIANVDQILFIATGAKPRTLPYLIDRISVSAEEIGTKFVLCLNKCDLDLADQLYQIYSGCGYTVLRTSAVSGKGIEELRSILSGKLSVPHGVFCSADHDAFEMAGILKCLSEIVTSRYHAAVLSMDRSIPIIGISMDERLTELLAEAGMGREFLLRTDNHHLQDDISRALKAAEKESAQIRQKLQDRVRNHKEALNAMGAFLKSYLD